MKNPELPLITTIVYFSVLVLAEVDVPGGGGGGVYL
jgi:hypothetical protein